MSRNLPDAMQTPEVELLSPMLNERDEGWTADFRGLTLRTALQPIYSLSHKRTIGYEALIRAFDPDQCTVTPLQLFELPDSHAENLLLDRLCRYLHIQNYSGIKDQLNWLFLNVSPQVVTSGTQTDSFFGHLLEKTGLPPHRIVIEIVEQPTDDADRLREAVAYYRKLGCLIAIDDFGAGHSNFERIWNLSPDIVKLDRALLNRATEERKARQILNGMVTLLHQSGCLVLLEGVETRDQAMIAIDAGVDFVQGFYFRRPSLELETLSQAQMNLDELLEEYKYYKQLIRDPGKHLSHTFSPCFKRTVQSLQQNAGMQQACVELLNNPAVSRCYLVDSNGIQIEDTLVSDIAERNQDPRFRPLESTVSADWYRQEYLREALAQPDILQVTAPYLCVTGAYMCVTLSLAYHHNDHQLRVLCCDILANSPTATARF